MDKWENLRHKPEYFAHLSDSIERRLQQVVAQKGYWPYTELISVLLNGSFQDHKLFNGGILKQV